MTGPEPGTGPDGERTFVFAYGSNLDEARMVGRVASARVMGRSRLEGHELRFHKRGWKDGTGKANAYRNGEGTAVVHGVVYQVDASELAALDVHETGYDRVLLDFEVEEPGAAGAEPVDGTASAGDVRAVRAWIYLARSEVIDDTLRPERWYVDHVMRGARAHGLPEELIAKLEAMVTEA